MLALFCATLSMISSCDSCICDANDDADSVDAYSLDLSWLAIGTWSIENFNLVLNICHMGKEDNVGSRGERGWWAKHVTPIVIGSREGGEDGIASIAGGRKKQVIVNSLIIGVTFREIILSSLGVLMGTSLLMTILNVLGQLAATCPTLALVALSCGADLKIILSAFLLLLLSIIPLL